MAVSQTSQDSRSGRTLTARSGPPRAFVDRVHAQERVLVWQAPLPSVDVLILLQRRHSHVYKKMSVIYEEVTRTMLGTI